MDLNALWIVIPAYNEAQVIAGVVRDLRMTYPRVIVVDDCSPDSTGDEARRSGAIVARHPINLGQGAALQTGIKCAIERGAQFIVTFDADGQHRVEDIATLCAIHERTRADIVIGSRFLGSAVNMPVSRRLLLKAAIVHGRLTTGVRLSDAHNGLRLITRAAAKRLRITQNRMAHASEIVGQIGRLGLAYAEAPVTIVYTDYSLRKGQKLLNSINILTELLISRLNR